jgi:hypothetical protein
MVEQIHIDGQKEAVLASSDIIMANCTQNPNLILAYFLHLSLL